MIAIVVVVLGLGAAVSQDDMTGPINTEKRSLDWKRNKKTLVWFVYVFIWLICNWQACI